MENAQQIHSVLKDKPKIDNGTWLPFLKAGQLAEDDKGKRYRITQSAINAGYESFKGGFINVNHSDKIKGKIADVKLEGEFAYAKLEGLDQEALDVINSPAYRGVSQQSFNLASIQNGDMIDVTSLKGQGLAIALYPKTPGCPLTQGCGVPLNSTIENIFSSNTQDDKTQIKSAGGTIENMAEYTPEQIKDMLSFMKSHPDMVDDAMKGMMKGMMGGNGGDGGNGKGGEIGSMITEIETLKSTIKAKDEQIAKFPETLKSTLAAVIEERETKRKEQDELAKAKDALFSTLKKERAEKWLSENPNATAGMIMSTVALVKEAAPQAGAGAGAGGEQINSTMKEDTDALEELREIGGMNKIRRK